MNLKEKILENFEGKVVRKDLTALVKGSNPVPVYVLEYLLGQYCAIDDDEIITAGIEKVKNVIRDNYVHRSDSEVVKAKIRDRGNYKVIDKISVSLNDKANIYEAEFASLGLRNVPIADKMVMENQKLLSGGGVWCILNIGYSHADDISMRWIIIDIKPIQVSNVNLDEYVNLRKEFTTDEWLDLLMHSIGLNPKYFNKRDKFIQLSRLIPHTENNYNFIELGPKGTGKSHIFSELSPHGVLVSGGDVSKARLFVNNSGNKIGLVGFWDVVALDEFEQEKGGKRTDGDLVKIMQNYMANQSFNRGKETYQATASMAFVGNTKHNVPYMLKNSHLFESIPEGYLKGAFLDRMHMYIPGWEVRILKTAVFSSEYGFIVDYLAELLREMRKYDFSSLMDKYVTLDGSLTTRDKTAIRKTFSGLVKLIYPHQEVSEKEVLELLNFSIEGRKRVKDQLYIIDETFRGEPVEFKYTILSNGVDVFPETLENLNYKAEVEIKDNEEEELLIATKVKKNIVLTTKQEILKDNQTGVSYKSLFGEYLKGARNITIQDPYIRLPYQFKNLVEFCLMLSDNKAPEDEINLEIITWNNEEFIRDSIFNFEEIQENVATIGIHLTYRLEEHHDCFIATDNGWKITLGRGLDIFEKIEGRFNVADIDQTKRRCKSCELTYFKI
ncbi:BREX system Lon protease-like protein BrxL [Tenacibaculum finnmarkense]|uniref:BREX system Lon protease-like protein BrxL n=4 Tax=Tenacibaculum finnmarkense TaxID=2781243 RepID=UPI00187B5962|nr:BREX system Lon protease-like protein BrxL [Tenacibaculum finnmarkense]MBE7634970.1 BREX system Lon protease-like protein BrxL [Tenacibaculum finnmarkense genomovar ulcerans]MCD8403777.1 BREX system Lon protease-like protein BrxL [Tenacibaculum finnmarkense genomovar finnmarkense]MCD8430883.1 BREX system Lon protease-like protein BrxL [Tenacibaculum finnmarkense genomovar ulcerans]MCD8433448.1 BREX system Lon protease-like protein BrxL [Tenacibaculum finnmarkense genomovar ulcerans]MCG88063